MAVGQRELSLETVCVHSVCPQHALLGRLVVLQQTDFFLQSEVFHVNCVQNRVFVDAQLEFLVFQVRHLVEEALVLFLELRNSRTQEVGALQNVAVIQVLLQYRLFDVAVLILNFQELIFEVGRQLAAEKALEFLVPVSLVGLIHGVELVLDHVDHLLVKLR